MLFTQSWVMDVILPLLAPGGLSWLSEASCESRSLMMLVPMVLAVTCLRTFVCAIATVTLLCVSLVNRESTSIQQREDTTGGTNQR